MTGIAIALRLQYYRLRRAGSHEEYTQVGAQR